MTHVVRLDRAPDVELLGAAVLVQGRTTLDVYRILGEGIEFCRRRDGIQPHPRLLQALAAFRAAAAAAVDERGRPDTEDMPDVRGSGAGPQLRNGELIGITEAAQICGVGERQARRRAAELGGTKQHGRWVFDRGLVQAYLDTNDTWRPDDH